MKLKRDRPKLVSVLTPVGDQCHTGYAMSLSHMLMRTVAARPANLGRLDLQSYGSTILPFGRQILAKTALEKGSTHMLWIDSDMEFPSDMLLRFLSRDEPIVGINALSRRPPFRPTAQAAPDTPLHTTPESAGLEKVHRTGFGVVWIASQVFHDLELPWFDFEYVPELAVHRGEDYSFFEKAKAAGYAIHIDHDLSKEIRHLGTFGFNPMMQAQAPE